MVEEHDKTKTGFLLSRWSRKRSSGSGFDVQFFYNRNRQYDGLGHDKDESIETTDIEFNQHMKIPGATILSGAEGSGRCGTRIMPAFDSSFNPGSYAARTYNVFVQDEIALGHDSVRLTAGTKVEWNPFSNTEIQPTARALWAPDQRQPLDGGLARGACALAERAWPVRARLDLRE